MCIRDSSGIELPEKLYKNVFVKAVNWWNGCEKSGDFFECDISDDKISNYLRFVIEFDTNIIVLHPLSYSTRLSETTYRMNVRESMGDAIILGGNVLSRVHVVLDNDSKRIGFVNYDEDVAEQRDEPFAKGLLIFAISALAVSTAVTVAYYFLSLKKIILF
eukprot:TRINITY_DN10147_c0_g1_i1.p1 TRINITY_DN10147_c0_g1~~TRINITY_DN10147_c0_g1_i1.p1  ORF type:complete len:161 (+),score=21.50 TRINITY_DN10147_c0_g1_i1:73-555(+)